jgi:hypothetical protein
LYSSLNVLFFLWLPSVLSNANALRFQDSLLWLIRFVLMVPFVFVGGLNVLFCAALCNQMITEIVLYILASKWNMSNFHLP